MYRACSEDMGINSFPPCAPASCCDVETRFGVLRIQRNYTPSTTHGWNPVFSPSDLQEGFHEFKVTINNDTKQRRTYAWRTPGLSCNSVWIVCGDSSICYNLVGDHNLAFAITLTFYGFVQYKCWQRCKTYYPKLLPIGDLQGLHTYTGRKWQSSLGATKVYDTRPGTTFLHIFQKRLQRWIDLKRVDTGFCPGKIKPVEVVPPPADVTDECVYQRFKKIMNLQKNGSAVGFSGTPSWKMHGIRFTEIVKVHSAWQNRTVLPWREIDGEFSYAARPRSMKKDGTVRSVYVMSPKLNAFVTQEYGEQRPIWPSNVRIVSGVGWLPFKHSYDVKDCDRKLLPYFRRLVRETYPDDEAILLCNFIHEGRRYPLPQFPSGICVFMKYITSAFTIALCDLASASGIVQVQGDGFTLDHELDSAFLPFVRKYPEKVINGFYIGAEGVHYVNANERLATPQFYDPFKLTGLKKWEFRRTIYIRCLNARDVVPPRDPELSRKFFGMSYRELMDEASACDPDIYEFVCRRMNLDGFGSGRGTTWHGVPTIGYVG